MAKYLVKQVLDAGVVVGYEIKPQTDAKHFPKGGSHIFVEGVDTKNPIMQNIDGELSIIEDPTETLNDLVEVKYKEMVADIYARMKIDFGTSKDVSAAAFANTWEAMIKRPSNYVDVELGFSNAAEVMAFAEDKILIADSYAVFRLKRINQFTAEKTTILGG